MKRGRACAARDPANGWLSQVWGQEELNSQRLRSDQLAIKSRNSHNVTAKRRALSMTPLPIAGHPAVLLLRLTCFRGTEYRNLFRDKGKTSDTQAVFRDDYRKDSALTLQIHRKQAATQPL